MRKAESCAMRFYFVIAIVSHLWIHCIQGSLKMVLCFFADCMIGKEEKHCYVCVFSRFPCQVLIFTRFNWW